MASDDLKTILDRIRKPLAFAAKDDFAHLKSLTQLETFIHSQIEQLVPLAGDSSALRELGSVFTGFD